jgi:hypothetical protein
MAVCAASEAGRIIGQLEAAGESGAAVIGKVIAGDRTVHYQ